MSPAHQQTPFQQCPAHQRAPSQQYREHQHTRASLTPSRARTSSIPVLPLSSLKPQRAPAHASPPQAVTRTSTSQPPPRTHQFHHFSPSIHNAHQRIPFLCFSSARAHHKRRCFLFLTAILTTLSARWRTHYTNRHLPLSLTPAPPTMNVHFSNLYSCPQILS